MFVFGEHILLDHADKMWRGPTVANQATGKRKGGCWGTAPDSLKYILILECGEGVFG